MVNPDEASEFLECMKHMNELVHKLADKDQKILAASFCVCGYFLAHIDDLDPTQFVGFFVLMDRLSRENYFRLVDELTSIWNENPR